MWILASRDDRDTALFDFKGAISSPHNHLLAKTISGRQPSCLPVSFSPDTAAGFPSVPVWGLFKRIPCLRPLQECESITPMQNLAGLLAWQRIPNFLRTSVVSLLRSSCPASLHGVDISEVQAPISQSVKFFLPFLLAGLPSFLAEGLPPYSMACRDKVSLLPTLRVSERYMISPLSIEHERIAFPPSVLGPAIRATP